MSKQVFVTAEWLFNEMKENNNLKIIDVPYGKKEYIDDNDPDKRRFINKHIPNAIEINKEDFESKDNELNIFSSDIILELLLKKGISSENEVVVYSDGYNASGRMAFICYWMGIDNIKILEGNFKSWEDKGLPIESGETEQTPIEDFGCKVPKRPEVLVSTPQDVLNKQESNDNFVLASIRSWREFLGEFSGYPYIETAGSPYGSRYAKASKERTDTDYLINSDGTIIDINEIIGEWKKWGINPEKEVAFFCGSGWRATIPFFMCLEEGWKNISVYDGGWYQWLRYHEKEPDKYKIQKGNPKSEEGIEIV